MTVYRWANKGLYGKCGRRVRLETWLVGKTIMTTAEALQTFHAQLADAQLKETARSVSVTERQQDERAEASSAFLKSERGA